MSHINPNLKVDNPYYPVPKANDIQEGGMHYQNDPIQVWDFIVANNIPYLEGNVIKYVVRHKKKNGLEDLKKAKHYIEKLMEQYEQHSKYYYDLDRNK